VGFESAVLSLIQVEMMLVFLALGLAELKKISNVELRVINVKIPVGAIII